jgi:hypothetical protein
VHRDLTFLFLKFLLILFIIFWLHLVKSTCSKSMNKVGLLFIYSTGQSEKNTRFQLKVFLIEKYLKFFLI